MPTEEKKVKPQDPVTVYMANKHYKPGQKVEVHSAAAEKLIEAGKAFDSEKKALAAIADRQKAAEKKEAPQA